MSIIVRMDAWHETNTAAQARVDLVIETPERTYPVYIAGPHLQFSAALEAGATLGMLAAMRTGATLCIEGEISESYAAALDRYMRRFIAGFPEFHAVSIQPRGIRTVTPAASSGRCASFFSGGVDSFFTLLKARSDVTDIVYIHGFDVRLDDSSRRAAVDSMCGAVAAELGVRYLSVESNMGKVLQDFGSWPQHAHGLALIAVARLLAGHIDKVLIPGSFSICKQKPWGSWLETDPLLSDERLQIIHDACEAQRMDKVMRLAGEPLALKYLRVCWERVDGMYNCCRCEKCLRTMTSLSILGMLDKTPAFTLPLEPRLVAQVCLPRPGLKVFAQQNLQLLRSSGLKWPELEKALQIQIDRSLWVARWRLKWRKRLSRWARRLRLFPTVPRVEG